MSKNKYWQRWKKYSASIKTHKNIELWYLLLRNFWQTLPKSYFWQRRRRLGCDPTYFWDFSIIFYFPKILTPKLFDNQRRNSQKMSILLDIRSCFTCGELTLKWNQANCQNIMAKIEEFFVTNIIFLCPSIITLLLLSNSSWELVLWLLSSTWYFVLGLRLKECLYSQFFFEDLLNKCDL